MSSILNSTTKCTHYVTAANLDCFHLHCTWQLKEWSISTRLFQCLTCHHKNILASLSRRGEASVVSCNYWLFRERLENLHGGKEEKNPLGVDGPRWRAPETISPNNTSAISGGADVGSCDGDLMMDLQVARMIYGPHSQWGLRRARSYKSSCNSIISYQIVHT